MNYFLKVNHWRGLYNVYRHLDRIDDMKNDMLQDQEQLPNTELLSLPQEDRRDELQ